MPDKRKAKKSAAKTAYQRSIGWGDTPKNHRTSGGGGKGRGPTPTRRVPNTNETDTQDYPADTKGYEPTTRPPSRAELKPQNMPNPYKIKWENQGPPSDLWHSNPQYRELQRRISVAIQEGATLDQAISKGTEYAPKTRELKSWIPMYKKTLGNVFNKDPYECFEDMACYYDRSIDQTPAGRVHLDNPFYTPVPGSPGYSDSKPPASRKKLLAGQYSKIPGLPT